MVGYTHVQRKKCLLLLFLFFFYAAGAERNVLYSKYLVNKFPTKAASAKAAFFVPLSIVGTT